MAKLAVVFPGQGSQSVGMGRDWAETHEIARRAFEEADDALGFSLSDLCWSGPAEDLQLTANTQPAILACSVAMFRVLEEVAGDQLSVVAMAGHSLGEYSALVAAGALEFGTALRLVRRRGQLMQEAVPVGQGAMAAVLGLDRPQLEQVLAEVEQGDEVCTLANLNSPQQLVVAGHTAAVERVAAAAKQAGAKLAKMLPVSAPFHSPLMAPAREQLTPDLEAAQFSDPRVPVWTNIDARPTSLGAEARDALIRQIDGPVYWTDTIQGLIANGVETILEVGPGKVLQGLGKRIDPSVDWHGLPEPASLDGFVSLLGT